MSLVQDKAMDITSGPGVTRLGDKLINPYSLEVIKEASILLGHQPPSEPTHYYLKVMPSEGAHIEQLENFADQKGYDFDWQPIHYEVVYEGDGGFIPDGDTSQWMFVPEYGAIKAKDLENFPSIPYEVVDPMYIPPYTTMLTYTAFVVSGSERFTKQWMAFVIPIVHLVWETKRRLCVHLKNLMRSWKAFR